MDYERKYKEALERASKICNSDFEPYDKSILCSIIFPELKESEDEKIKREIVAYINELADLKNEKIPTKCLAWLEKQGEKKHIINVPPREVILSIWDLGNEWKELTNGCISTEYGTQLDYIQKHWHESEYYLKEKQGKQTQLDYEHADIPQKDFAPIEPKFKVGDWITNGNYTWEVTDIAELDYVLRSQDGNIVDDTISYVDEQFHSFTIEDAKNGDVLINWNNTTFIFKAIEDETVKFHMAYNEKWDTIKTPSTKLSQLSHLGLPEPQFEFHLAAKEQRDLLFSKMKEEGYEWDSEKKELKKIGVKTLDADNVIEWLKDTINETTENYGVYDETHLILPYNSIEDLINDFKEDFGLC